MQMKRKKASFGKAGQTMERPIIINIQGVQEKCFFFEISIAIHSSPTYRSMFEVVNAMRVYSATAIGWWPFLRTIERPGAGERERGG